jgi:hypothetical protein
MRFVAHRGCIAVGEMLVGNVVIAREVVVW